jgi:hypothetical protein
VASYRRGLVANSVLEFPDPQGGHKEALGASEGTDPREALFLLLLCSFFERLVILRRAGAAMLSNSVRRSEPGPARLVSA